MGKHIDDPLFLGLIHKFLTNAIKEIDRTDHTNHEVGITPGAVLSPILINIVLRDLDLFATQLCKEWKIYYGRYCEDCSIATAANNDAFAWGVLQKMQDFL